MTGQGGIRRRAVPPGATSAMCLHCNRIKPLAAFVHNKGRPGRVCKACAKAREKVLAEGRLNGNVEVDNAPDLRVPAMVRVLLDRDRANGRPWDRRRFRAIVRAACADAEDGYEWRAVIEAQAPEWRRAYTRTGKRILGLSVDLVDDHEPVVEHGSHAVA